MFGFSQALFDNVYLSLHCTGVVLITGIQLVFSHLLVALKRCTHCTYINPLSVLLFSVWYHFRGHHQSCLLVSLPLSHQWLTCIGIGCFININDSVSSVFPAHGYCCCSYFFRNLQTGAVLPGIDEVGFLSFSLSLPWFIQMCLCCCVSRTDVISLENPTQWNY